MPRALWMTKGLEKYALLNLKEVVNVDGDSPGV